MAFVFTDAVVTVNAIDLSNHVSQVTVEDTADEVDVTAFGGNGYKQLIPGLKDATITMTFFQDFAASSVHATLNALYISGSAVPITVKPTSATTSATNPKGSLTGKLYSYNGLGGAVGDALTIEASFRNAGSGISWGTT